jgi:seryl-tRNA synthetase
MLDIKFVKENKNDVKANCIARKVNPDFVDEVLSLHEKLSQLKHEIEHLNGERNKIANELSFAMATGFKGTEVENRRIFESYPGHLNAIACMPPEVIGKLVTGNGYGRKEILIEEGKKIKERISKFEIDSMKVEKELEDALFKIPNMSVGAPNQTVVLKTYGVVPNFGFKPLDHMQLASQLDLIDFEAGAEVVGNKFYYLKNDLAFLEMALALYVMRRLTYNGFIPFITPDLAKADIVEGIGFNPRGDNSQIYRTDNNLCLIGTSEITLGGMYRNKVIDEGKLPVKLAGFSHCFRTEAGAPGKEGKGIFRVHQFSKVEMFVICKPEDSESQHKQLVDIQEEIFRAFQIPYQVVDIPIDDLGAPAARKYDIEAWMPGRKDYCEVTSASNCTDFQSRRLNIKYRMGREKAKYVHTLNATAVAIPRTIIAIMENHQQADGGISIPSVLRGLMAKDYIKPNGLIRSKLDYH